VDVLMNVLLVGTGGFINGPDPKIPAAAAHTWLCDGGHKTLFSGRRRCGRRYRSHGSRRPCARSARHIWFGPATLRRRCRAAAAAAVAESVEAHSPPVPGYGGGGGGEPARRLEIVQNPKFSSTTGRIFSFTSIFTLLRDGTYVYFIAYYNIIMEHVYNINIIISSSLKSFFRPSPS